MTLVVVYVCSMYISQKWDPSQSHEEKKPQYDPRNMHFKLEGIK